MKNYVINLLFCMLKRGANVDIKREYRTGRGFYGFVAGFDFKSGKIVVQVFDYGMYFPRRYDKSQLEK